MPKAGDDEVTTGAGASPIEEPGATATGRKPHGKAAKKAARAAKREATKAAKHEAKAARKAKKALEKAAKAERSAAKAAAETSKRAAKTAKRAPTAPREAEVAAAPVPSKGQSDATTGSESRARTRATGGRAGHVAAAAGIVLQEVAGLVRQATEPAASRIVERVSRRPGAEPEPEVVAEVVTEPEVEVVAEVVAEPETQPEVEVVAEVVAEPEVAAEPEPEPEVVAEPEPEVVAEPEPEPEPAVALEPEVVAEPVTQPVPTAQRPPLIELPAGAVIGASVDVGATSVHLLVAAVGGHRVEPLLDESVFLGLGDRVSTDGLLGPEAREELVAALVGYADTARQLGASRITIVGTEPMRRADDVAAVVAAVEARAGVPLHVLDHDEEGLLMLLGVTKGRPITSNLLVVDIGGGSSEFVVVDRDGHEHAVGLPLGANRLTRDLVRSDPPSLGELEAIRARARQVVAGAPDVQPGEIVAVGGTASNLLRLLPATALDRVLTRRRLTVALAMLTVERSLEAAERHLVRPARARILPAGAIIVDVILERYGTDRMRVSEEGIREGLVLAAAAAGPAWRDRLPQLVRGWPDEAWPLE